MPLLGTLSTTWQRQRDLAHSAVRTPENCTKQWLHDTSTVKWQSVTSKNSWLSSTAGTTDEVQSKISLLLSQEGWLEGVKLVGKSPPCISWSSARKPHKEKATQKHQLFVISYSSLMGVYVLWGSLIRQWKGENRTVLVAECLQVLRRLGGRGSSNSFHILPRSLRSYRCHRRETEG